jgi:hypothetical protein
MQLINENRIIRWLCGCLIFLCGCSNQQTNIPSFVVTKADSLQEVIRIKRGYLSVLSIADSVKSGDLITRTGNDFTSESLRTLHRRDETYSHCGVASIENDSVFVYHALGGEWNPDQKIKRDPLVVFAEPASNRGIGVFRFNISDSLLQGTIQELRHLFETGVMFDMDFNMKTDERMYCAEFVCKAYETGSQKKLQFPLSRIGTFEFIGVDDIFLHPLCTPKFKIVYKFSQPDRH